MNYTCLRSIELRLFWLGLQLRTDFGIPSRDVGTWGAYSQPLDFNRNGTFSIESNCFVCWHWQVFRVAVVFQETKNRSRFQEILVFTKV